MRFTAKPLGSVLQQNDRAAAQYQRDLRAAALIATDRASVDAQRGIQERIQSVGLGRLSQAVGQTSALKKRRTSGDPYGVIFAKGGDNSLAGGALESYSRGATIRPGPGKTWLSFPTRALPKFISAGGKRQRLTVELYNQSSLVQSIGPLIFRPLSASRAIWVVRGVSLSAKTGRAKALRPGSRTRSRVAQKEIVAFIGIRVTTRAQRFDKDGVVQFYAGRVPRYMEQALDDIQRGR